MAVRSSLGEFIGRAATQLRDDAPDAPFTRWTATYLTALTNEAMREIMAHRPDAFARTVEIYLKAGDMQQLDEAYSSLSSIEQSIAPDGSNRSVTKGDYRYYKILRRPTKTSGLYHVLTYTKHPIDDQVFYVEPAVPLGATPRVKATVIVRPPTLLPSQLSLPLSCRPEFEPQAMDWVLHRALAGDFESASARDQSKVHLESFVKLMGLKDKAATAYHNGMHDPTQVEQRVAQGRRQSG